MPQRLDREQVLHIAELAKLALSDEEVERFADQLSAILEYADMLRQLDATAIPPTAQVVNMRNITRPDCVQESLTPEEALANAPDRHGNLVRVRAVFE